METLIQLIAAHLIGDFMLQTDNLCRLKYSELLWKRIIGLLIHSGIQAVLTYLFIADWSLWCIPISIFIIHFFIDFIKVCLHGRRLPALLLDQLAHYFVLFGIWMWMWRHNLIVDTDETVWLVITSYIAVLAPTSILIKSFMEYEGWIPTSPTLKGLPNAGKWIGYLERILILTFIYTSNIEGIGFLLAAKSIFRFGELNKARDVKITEYVLIGTFMSFTIACLLGFGVVWWLRW